ncbi:biotin transporter BioY [Solicola gregarius]|uniref:Biotin transporter n=1 Tax=Solicola gregarius TaxID=2908642 RepID=A0AA46YPN0_9ACTN|nr:biotin transporter BioY [Solicola gregarius]UYM07783.1 biotin transporter BioY [Solicola gregarius]
MPRDATARPETPARRTTTTTDVSLIAFFAALIAVCAIMPGIHVGGLAVPITLQTFGVMLAGACLGARRGFLAALLYLAVGFAGLPVFADATGGLATFAKPSIGYLLAFPIAAFVCGLLVERLPHHRLSYGAPLIFACAMVASILITHPMGIAGMHWRIDDFSWREAFTTDLTFWPGDVIKNVCVGIVAAAAHRAFPDLLPRR